MTKDEKGIKLAYYEDNYVREALIPETERLPCVKFIYRPLNVIQAAKFTEKIIGTKSIEDTIRFMLELVSKHIVGWDLQKRDGSVVDFASIDELGHIDADLMQKIGAVVRNDRSTLAADLCVVKDAVKNL